MKILWVCNVPVPEISKALNIPISFAGGWLDILSNQVASTDDVELAISFPSSETSNILAGSTSSYKFYGFANRRNRLNKYNSETESQFLEIIKQFEPHIVHIWGSELPHSLAMVNACKNAGIIDKVVISIQGLASVYANHYLSSLPINVIYGRTLRDIIFNDSISKQQKMYEIRGRYEIEALTKVSHVIGRTDWDKACVQKINSNLKYHFCNETLRYAFYNNRWNMEACEKFSIFTSQGTKPIKGLHFLLEALAIVLKSYPNAHLYIAGHDLTKQRGSLFEKIKMTKYGQYLVELIDYYNLSENITFTGPLNEIEMSKRYLNSNVFVSPSTIENSPNSIGEAMSLGVPVVASNVGGVSSMLEHNKQGFLYQHDAPYMLAYYIKKIFNNNDSTLELSRKSVEKAMITHNKEDNYRQMLEIYREINSSLS